MLTWAETFIECPDVASTLVWEGDALLDPVSRLEIDPDCSIHRGSRLAAYSWDRAIGMCHEGTSWAAVYANRHTKALLLKDGEVHRELNRSYYFARAYDYPIALAVGPEGNAIVIHCPDSYDILVCEDAESGAKLGECKPARSEFLSRLAVSPGHRYLLEAGWLWHPVGVASYIDIESLLSRASRASGTSLTHMCETESAAFLGNDRIVVTTTDEVLDQEAVASPGPWSLAVWSIPESRWQSVVPAAGPLGTLMPWKKWVISFFDHPKAIDLETGQVLHRWNRIESGRESGSYYAYSHQPPVMAIDPMEGRFAVQKKGGITIVRLAETP